MLFMALFRVQIIHQTIQNNNRKEEKSPKAEINEYKTGMVVMMFERLYLCLSNIIKLLEKTWSCVQTCKLKFLTIS